MATVNVPAAVRRALALAALAELQRAGRSPTAAELARHAGWSPFVAKAIVSGLRRDGLWPDPPDPSVVALERERAKRARAGGAEQLPVPDPPPKPARERPDIEAECLKIRAKWTESIEMSRRAGSYGYRPARVLRSRDARERGAGHDA